jgi:Condensation domain/TubC N-terminal docking domain
MRAVELASILRAIGARLSVSGEELKVHAPRGALTPEIKRAIQDHRAELLGWFRVTPPSAPTPGPARQSYPLSHNQRQLWFEQQLRREASHYNVPIVMEIGSSATVERVEQTLQSVMARHAVLRARFPVRGDTPVMEIESEAPFALSIVDLPNGTGDAKRRALLEFLLRPFDLSEGPVFRACVVRGDNGGRTLAVSLHHIVADGWSMGILLTDFQRAYMALESGSPFPPIDPSPHSYGDFSIRQMESERRQGGGPLLESARAMLSRAPELALLYDYPRPEEPTHRGGICVASLSGAELDRLSAIARQCGVTVFTLFAAAYAVMLYHESGQEFFTIGTDVAGRDDPAWERVVGHFVNQIVMAVDLSGNPTLGESISRASSAFLRAHALRHIPFDMMVKGLREGGAERRPLFAVKIVMQPPLEDSLKLPGFRILEIRDGGCKFDLLLNIWFAGDGAQLAIEYSRDVFSDATGGRLLQELLDVLRSLRIDTLSERLFDLDERLSKTGPIRSRAPGCFSFSGPAAALGRTQ